MPDFADEPKQPWPSRPQSCQSKSVSALACLLRQSQSDFELEFFEKILLRNPDDLDVLRRQGELLARKGLFELAQQVDQRLVALCPHDCVVHYNHACSLARGGRKREALAALTRALEHGYDDFDYLELDSDLDSLRNDSRFRRLIMRFGASKTAPEAGC